MEYGRLTTEKLKKAVRTAMSSEANLDELRRRFPAETARMDDVEAAAWAAGRICTQELLDDLDSRMELVPACRMVIGSGDTGRDAVNAENEIGYHAEVMPKIWPKPMAEVGYNDIVLGGEPAFWYRIRCSWHIDVDGEVVSVVSYANGYGEYGDGERVIYSRLAGPEDGYTDWCLMDACRTPEEWDGFWDT